MIYFAVTQKTANWLLNNSKYLKAIQNELLTISTHRALNDGVLVVGSLRIAAIRDSVLCLWNADYLSGTDYEEWGFLKIQGPLSLSTEPSIAGDVFKTQLYLINQRLQGLLLPDDRFIHRSIGENFHTSLAGGGGETRQYSIGWYEGKVSVGTSQFHSIISIGPSSTPGEPGFQSIKRSLIEARDFLPKLVSDANSLLRLSLSRPTLDIPVFVDLVDRFAPDSAKRSYESGLVEEPPMLESEDVGNNARYITLDWTYDDWIKAESPLSSAQRTILESDVILRQPLRIIGAAGSGKSLLMQLLAMRQLQNAKNANKALNILYIVHNSEMQSLIWKRFETLGGSEFLAEMSAQRLRVCTLFEYCREQIEFPSDAIIDKDALQTKIFQRQIVLESLRKIFEKRKSDLHSSALFRKIQDTPELTTVFADLITTEIGIAIKGRDLGENRKQYVESDKPFTRLHGLLDRTERDLIFDVFEEYHRVVFKEFEVLDADDVAISLLGQLRTPLWEMKRKKVGFDFVFVDETQLFNQNERQLFRLLPRRTDQNLPIALALDEAQELRGSRMAGFGILGIGDMANKTLTVVHRCTPDILKLAFFVIQRSTDLFGPEFPNFTRETTTVIAPDVRYAKKPRLVVREESPNLGKSVLKEIRTLRRNLRQIAVVINSEKYWKIVVEFLKTQQIPLYVLTRRGESLDAKTPMVYISRPENVGGQEFDAVICVGLEHGVVPPMIEGHIGLAEALDQQALREMYLVFTRARYQLVILNSKHSAPSHVIQSAIVAGLIEDDI